MVIDNTNHIHNNNAFAKGTPTLFVLDTPFQLLCVMEFIAEFAVEDYLIIAQMERSEKRNEQVIHMLKERKLIYEINWVEDYWGMVNSFISDEKRGFGNWKRAVVGNFYALDQWVTASKSISDDASIVFTDDGASSINLLQSGYGVNTEYEPLFFELWKTRGIDCAPYIYTIYADISTRRFVTYNNSFANLSKGMNTETADSIYVIGTNSGPFSCVMGISLIEYEKILWKKMKEVRRKYPKEEIIYIPHGRDAHESTKIFCERLHIEYQTLNSAVEYYFVRNRKSAKAIYGFGSTALLTLKKLMPDANVVNWIINNSDGEAYKDYTQVANYYHQHGIGIDRISLPIQTRMLKAKRRLKKLIKRVIVGKIKPKSSSIETLNNTNN